MQSGSPQQPGVRPGMTPVLAQQLARPPNPATSGSQMTQQAGQPMMQGGPRTQEVIWEGELQWKENVKAADGKPVSSGNKTIHTVRCQAKASKDAGQGNSEVKFQNWPQTLILQLIPKDLTQTIGSHFFEGSGSVLFRPEPSESLDALTKTLSSGYAGCVHFTGVGAAQCDIKVLILLYSNDKKAYLGFIPNDQAQFVERIRMVIQQQKSKQAMMQGQPNQQQIRPGQPMGQQPGIQQPGMVQPGMGQQVMSTSGTQMGMMQQGGAPMMTTAGPGQPMMATSGGQMIDPSLQQQGPASAGFSMGGGGGASQPGSMQRIQNLEQQLQREKEMFAQQQQGQLGQMGPQGSMPPMGQQQVQQRMTRPQQQQGLRQILQLQQQRQQLPGGPTGMMQQQQMQQQMQRPPGQGQYPTQHDM